MVPIADDNAFRIYGSALVLVRPDQHVAWRGETLPENCESILTYAAGRTTEVSVATS
ncbi:aromatic-ring hydroxylase C-terminal domain-containing protein [Cupriavidus basilensis]